MRNITFGRLGDPPLMCKADQARIALMLASWHPLGVF